MGGWQGLGAAEMMQVQFLAVAVGKPVRCNDRYRVRDSAASSGVPQFVLIELYDVCWRRHGGGGRGRRLCLLSGAFGSSEYELITQVMSSISLSDCVHASSCCRRYTRTCR